MTVAFRPDKERLSELLPHLGQEITLKVESIGTLHKNGILCNIGVNDSHLLTLKWELVGTRISEETCCHNYIR